MELGSSFCVFYPNLKKKKDYPMIADYRCLAGSNDRVLSKTTAPYVRYTDCRKNYHEDDMNFFPEAFAFTLKARGVLA
jgi:hypothetical protein